MKQDISHMVTNWFHAVKDEYRKDVERLIRMFENAAQEQDIVGNELVHLQKQLNHKV